MTQRLPEPRTFLAAPASEHHLPDKIGTSPDGLHERYLHSPNMDFSAHACSNAWRHLLVRCTGADRPSAFYGPGRPPPRRECRPRRVVEAAHQRPNAGVRRPR